MTNHSLMFAELVGEHADQVHLLASIGRLIESAGGICMAQAAAGRVVGLEPGSIAAGMVIGKFSAPTKLLATARDDILPLLRNSLPRGVVPAVYAIESLPEGGLPEMPELPTIASIPRPPGTPRNAFMIVRGRPSDEEPLSAYRKVILPMLKERGAYFEATVQKSEQVTVLSGQWSGTQFSVLRFPSRAAAEEFWFCDRYQKTAIPLRLGAGTMTVHLLEAANT